MERTVAIRLTKHHGAGNDFLVLLDGDGRGPLAPAEVAALCHRHFGIGADGLLRGTPGTNGAALAMELRNADGGEAEMSGNGIRCLVQAAVDAGWAEPGTIQVDTAAGRRQVAYQRGGEPGTGHAAVDMGPVVLGTELLLDEPAGLRSARQVTVGNPHIVLLLDRPVGDAVVELVGGRLERSVAGGANVEFVWPGSAPGELVLRVWERGVGETLACGTGTCAAAAAARSWGLPGTGADAACYVVHNPGGALEVELRRSGAVLGGPTVVVGEVRVDEMVLHAMVAAHAEDLAAHP
jgi:diaminopimelate epimerase